MIDNEGFKISDQGKPHFVINYDKNGNIQSLDRKGHIVQNPFQANSGDFGLMDRLEYGYDSGNKLLNVSDRGTTETGFKDGNITQSTSEASRDYVYDENGNMTTDRNKGIEAIEYNHLNLPTRISINGNGNIGTIEYVYDATGVKLQKQVSGTDNGNTVNTTTQYASNYIYENGELQFFNHPEGYVTPNGANGYDYVYQYKDHLGNVRLSFTNDPSNSGTPTIIEESNYYPFGLKMRGFNGGGDTSLGNDVAEKFKYNGKEFQNDLGYNAYDYDARHYDPSIGRWFQIDPLADINHSISMTPYHYAANNPIVFIDPDGQDWFYYKAEGEDEASYHWHEGSEYSHTYTYTDDDGNEQTSTIELQGISEFIGIDQNQSVYKFNNDGTVASSSQDDIKDGITVLPITTRSGDVTQVDYKDRSKILGTGIAGVVTASQSDSPMVGPGDVLAAGLLLKMLYELVNPPVESTYTTLEFAKDASKNEKHGDGGRSLENLGGRLAELEAQLANAKTRKEKERIKTKIRRERQNAEKKKKGEEHSRGKKQ